MEPSVYSASLIDRARAALGAERARRSGSRSFASFVKQSWHVVDPAPLIWNWHLEAVCMHLEAAARGLIKRLIINIPPRHGKSNLFAILWPAWIWLELYTEQFLFLSYSSTLSVEHSVKCRQIIESPWYQNSYAPAWKLTDDQNVKHDFVNTAGGRRRATSIGGSITGLGAGIIGLDDPLNAEEAHSKAARDQANRVISEVVSTRLNDPRTGRIVLIMQRLHEEDPTGYLMEGGGWEHLVLPSEFESERRCITYCEVHVPATEEIPAHEEKKEFWRDPRQTEGELLFPDRFTRSVLTTVRAGLRETAYAAQHQQRPAPAGGIMFMKEWWRFWKPDGTGEQHRRPKGCYDGPARPLPADFDQVIISVDANFKNKSDADPVSIQAWGAAGPDRFLLHIVNAPLGFVGAVKAIVSMIEILEKSYTVRAVIIETAANGDAIVETLKEKISSVIGVKPEGGKEARAWASQPMIQGGNCYLQDGMPGLDEYVEEFATFPRGRHDDRVDSWGQAMMYMAHGPVTTMQLWMDAL